MDLNKSLKNHFDLIEWRLISLKEIPEMTINKTLPVSLCMMVSAAVFAADNTETLIMDGGPCLDLTRPIERLTCFEDQARAAQQPGAAIPQQKLPVVSIPRGTRQQPAQSPPQVEPQPASETPQEVAQEVESPSITPADSVEDNFGLPEERVNEGKERTPANELIARVAEIKEFDRNRFLITLENGQVWEQINSKRFALAEGDEVRIYSTRWGSSYRLSSQSHRGFIQVQRLR